MLHDYLNVLVLFLVVSLGIALAKAKWLTDASNTSLTKLLLNITLPATLVLSITSDFTHSEFIRLLPDVILPTAVILTLMALSYLLTKVIKVNPADRGLFIGLCSMSSTIFFGIPITLAVYGYHGLPYALLTYAAQTLIYWTLGLYLLDSKAIDTKSCKGLVKSIGKEIVNMPLIAFALGVGILFLGIKVPAVINTFLGYLSGMTSGLAMLIVGTIIFISGIKNIKINRILWVIVIFRFLVAPALVLAFGWLFSIDREMVKITILICSLPIPNTTVILAEKYKANLPLATGALSFSIGIYLIFLPVILFAIHTI